MTNNPAAAARAVPTFTEQETRTLRTFQVTNATPEPRRNRATMYLPTKVTLEVSNPDTPNARLMPVRVTGRPIRANGTPGPETDIEPCWPMNWNKAPEFVQAAIRHANLEHLTNLNPADQPQA